MILICVPDDFLWSNAPQQERQESSSDDGRLKLDNEAQKNANSGSASAKLNVEVELKESMWKYAPNSSGTSLCRITFKRRNSKTAWVSQTPGSDASMDQSSLITVQGIKYAHLMKHINCKISSSLWALVLIEPQEWLKSSDWVIYKLLQTTDPSSCEN